jgi:hypothetical protein
MIMKNDESREIGAGTQNGVKSVFREGNAISFYMLEIYSFALCTTNPVCLSSSTGTLVRSLS